MTVGPDPVEVRRLYRSGVSDVSDVAARLSVDQWGRLACGEWSATDIARHLLAVSRWYHQWLDRALAGEADPPFPDSELARRNSEALADLTSVDGPTAIAEFTAGAHDYVDRIAAHWDATYGFPYGTVTAGLHCGVAAVEWNLHAWDLSTVVGPRHRPSHPDRLFMAAGTCFAAAEGGLRGTAMALLVPIAARRDPWEALLRRSGRDPSG